MAHRNPPQTHHDSIMQVQCSILHLRRGTIEGTLGDPERRALTDGLDGYNVDLGHS